MRTWTKSEIPDLSGYTVVVTGANTGLGRYSAGVLAESGASVLLACRNRDRGERATSEVNAMASGSGKAELVQLDLADLDSVRSAATAITERSSGRVDVLINNAGVMAPPLQRTQQGFELQFGGNHLGHAALTWLLGPALAAAGTPDAPARVVTLSSLAHRSGAISFSDPQYRQRPYRATGAYAQSKLANLMFAMELDRRCIATGTPIASMAAHPGMANSDLFGNSLRSRPIPGLGRLATLVNAIGTQPLAQGALPQLFAATAPQAQSGAYYGPSGRAEIRGKSVSRSTFSPRALDRAAAAQLWELTAELTGVSPFPAAVGDEAGA